MELRVLGCHGGETNKHRSSSFLLDGVLGIDAGATAGGLTLEEQSAVRAVHKCSPLKNLPPEKYGSWREMEINFDPKEML